VCSTTTITTYLYLLCKLWVVGSDDSPALVKRGLGGVIIKRKRENQQPTTHNLQPSIFSRTFPKGDFRHIKIYTNYIIRE
jgi:hypothetical protein